MVEQDDQWFPDTGALADDLARESKRVLARREIAHVELYHRMSRTLRVTHSRDGHVVAVRSGCDEGIALRTWDAHDSRLRFAAASGRTAEAIERVVDRALLSGAVGSVAPGDRCAREGPLVDHDEEVGLPDADRLASWLAEAREAFAAADGGGAGPDRSWVEVASTWETWVGDGQVLGSRRRVRGWALLEVPMPEGAAAPLILAARSWPDLDPGAWVRMRSEGLGVGRAGLEMPAGRLPVLFSPGASTTLVLALVRAVPPDGSRFEVGPGFRALDDPGEPGALFGGVFDDLGFPTARTLVADGRTMLTRLFGPGHYRRPSFRDAPVCLPANLVVEPPEAPAPSTGLIVHRAAVHVLSPERWVLEVDGTWWSGGEPRRAIRGARVPTGPHDLLSRCIAGVGAPLASYRGVRTPALLFDGLPVTP
ncbi:MAG TPA: hypothetical protein VLE71_01485 [Actinomycetota bacterium]|nr:hypothetical protein [Actinomycetota bacterium]